MYKKKQKKKRYSFQHGFQLHAACTMGERGGGRKVTSVDAPTSKREKRLNLSKIAPLVIIVKGR